ncbi:MAG: HPF/RaiA family ribosome-associated protein [Geminicoccaceae bacterium]
MEKPLEISFRHMNSSPAVEARLREKVGELETFFDRIIGCRVVVEQDHRHHRQGNLFRISLDITLPGKEIAINKKGPKNQAHQDVYVAIRDAFNAAKRKIEDHARVRRGKVKAHDVPPHGHVTTINRDGGFGFVRLVDGQEVYFHQNSVTNGGFESLDVGAEVRLSIDEKEGVDGPQATSVQPIGKHHLPPVT